MPKLGEEFLAIGSDEDTLQSVFGQPKPRRDFDRAFKNHNKLLRCKCKLKTDETTDRNRRFVLTYFLEVRCSAHATSRHSMSAPCDTGRHFSRV